MGKKYVSEEEFIQLLNVELKKHSFYQEGMKVVKVPESAKGYEIRGYNLKGADNLKKILADIDYKVREKYDIKYTRRN